MSKFVSIILQTFSSVSSALSVVLFRSSSTPDITWHDLREYCFNLSTSIFSNSLVFVATKLKDCVSRSICSRLVTRLVNLSILLSWILIISRRSSIFGLEEKVVLAYGVVVTGVSDSVVVGIDELDFDVKGRVDLFLVFILLLLLFPTILVSVLVLISCRLLQEFSQLLSQAAILFKPLQDHSNHRITHCVRKLICESPLISRDIAFRIEVFSFSVIL